jgi:hypothetical protein
MGLFSSEKSKEEKAIKLRSEAGKLRMFGQFDEALEKYKRAYKIYKKLGNIDSQCNVLCSIVESSRSNERKEYLFELEVLCNTIKNPEEKAAALRNFAALKERLKSS